MLHLALLAIYLMFSGLASAANIVTYSVTDDAAATGRELTLDFRNISNEDGRTRIAIDIHSSNAPFTIYKAEWHNCDSVLAPLEPFTLIARTDEVTDKDTEWHISIDFPFSASFDEADMLVLSTDRGIIRCPTSTAGELRETINLLHDRYGRQLETSRRDSRHAWLLLSATIFLTLVAAVCGYVVTKRRFSRKRKELEELSLLMAERTEKNRELEAKVNALYGTRLDTLNMLCNEYFEKSDSENLRLTIYNEVEKHILALRDRRSVARLEEIVNTYLDGIMTRIREQIPSLGIDDMRFLTYLYAGFSPRAICIFTDIKVKNFYNRRSRLKERIMASGAPDRELFVSRM